MAIGTKMKEKRVDLRMTLEDLAQKVGVSRQTIQRYETGVISNIPSDKIEKIATALKTTPAYLMGWEEVPVDMYVSESLDGSANAKKEAPNPISEAEALRIYAESKKGGPLTQEELDRLDNVIDTIIKGIGNSGDR